MRNPYVRLAVEAFVIVLVSALLGFVVTRTLWPEVAEDPRVTHGYQP